MNVAQIVAAVLTVPAITAIIGTRLARVQLPQGSPLPGLVYSVPNSKRIPRMNLTSGPQLMRSRIQVTGLATNPEGVDQLLDLVNAALDLKSGTYAGVKVSLIESDIRADALRDPDTGNWYGSQDFIMFWYQ